MTVLQEWEDARAPSNGASPSEGDPGLGKLFEMGADKHVIDGKVLHHIDLKNFIGIVDGTDHWAGLRSGLGF